MNANPIKIQVRDINHHNITNAKVKVIAPNGDILFNEESPNGEIILDDIEKLKKIHRFKVEIEHPHYKSTPKTLASCIRESCKDRFHTLEFPYQDKLLVSSIYAEIKEIESKESKTPQQENCPHNNANAICLPTRTYNVDTNTTADQEATESLKHIQIHLKAYYNQDSIPNKEKQYQEQKRETKWGYIISSPYQHITKENISFPLKEHETFRILADLEGRNITGAEITIQLKEEWLNKQIRFFAFVENPKYEAGVNITIFTPIETQAEKGLIDVSGYIMGFGVAVGRNLVIKGTKFISEIQGNRYLKRESREMQGIARESLNNKDAREWYVNTQLPKIKDLGNRILTLEERAKFHFNFRNQAKKDTRDAMRDRSEAGRLEYKEKIKTWEEWIEYVRIEKGLTKIEDIYNYTIEASSRSRTSVNESLRVSPK